MLTFNNKPSAEEWNNTGESYLSSTRYEEAIDYFYKAIEIDPYFATAWHNMGSAFGNLERYNEAIKYT
jgi:tetratricopeptide (TPR) repeat protein